MPLNFQVLPCQLPPGFLAVLAFLLLARHAGVQTFKFLLCLAIVAGIVYGVSIGVGIVGFQSYINSYLLSSRTMARSALTANCT